jgi:hypothetical protein
MAVPVVNFPLGSRGILLSSEEWGYPDGTWTLERNAAGNYSYQKTAAAATTHPFVNISRAISRVRSSSVNAPLGTELQSGGLLTGFDLFYSIATAGLTSLTPTLYQTPIVNNTAIAPVAVGGTISPFALLTSNGPTSIVATPVATQANPYSVRYTLGTPYIIGANIADVEDFFELVVVDPGTSVFNLYGIGLLLNDYE